VRITTRSSECAQPLPGTRMSPASRNTTEGRRTMLTQHATAKSITDAPTFSLHKQQPASRTPHPESTTSNATRTQPHTATAETRHTLAWPTAHRPGGLIALAIQYGHMRTIMDARTSSAYGTRNRGGIHSVLDVETALAAADTAARFRDRVASGERISGPAASRALISAAQTPPRSLSVNSPPPGAASRRETQDGRDVGRVTVHDQVGPPYGRRLCPPIPYAESRGAAAPPPRA
jgi:hypothetical protein